MQSSYFNSYSKFLRFKASYKFSIIYYIICTISEHTFISKAISINYEATKCRFESFNYAFLIYFFIFVGYLITRLNNIGFRQKSL